MDKLTPEQRKRNMQANKAKGTKIEVLLAKKLWHLGFRYRKNDKTVYGKPDIVFKSKKLAIFCDGEFWHGKDWAIHKADHKSHQQFWYNKIEGNIARDKKVNEELKNEGWRVLRFWETDIEKNTDRCLEIILKELTGENI